MLTLTMEPTDLFETYYHSTHSDLGQVLHGTLVWSCVKDSWCSHFWYPQESIVRAVYLSDILPII
jgi:hypothetical protein